MPHFRSLPLAAVLLAATHIAVSADVSAPRPATVAPELLNAPLTATDFTDTAASSDEYEKRAGQIAAERGRRRDVRQLGAQLVTDHTQTSIDLAQAASDARLPAPQPKLHPGYRRKLEKLQAVLDEEFDQEFLQQQVENHAEALELMRTYRRVGTAAPLVAVATKAEPIVAGHLEHCLMLQKSFD
jgi:putative membrane protein